MTKIFQSRSRDPPLTHIKKTNSSCIVSICRLIPISKLLHQPRYGDVTWHWTPVAIWTQVELTFCIICACVPILKPFLSRHFPSIFPNNPDTRNRDTAFESPGLSTTIRFPAMLQLQQQQLQQLQLQQQLQEQQQQQRRRERGWSTAEHSQVSPRIGGPVASGAASSAAGGPGATVVRKASTWTIGRMSTRRKVWSLWGRWGASVADVEMGMHGGAGGMFGDGGDSDRGNSAGNGVRGSRHGSGGDGRGLGVTVTQRGRGSVGTGDHARGGGGGGGGVGGGNIAEEVGESVVMEGKRPRVSTDVKSEACTVNDVGSSGGTGGMGPASDARSSTVIAAESVCNSLGLDFETDNFSESSRFGVDSGRVDGGLEHGVRGT